MKKLLAVSFWLIALGNVSSQTFAQCDSMFQGHLNWALRPDANGFDVGFKLTSNRADGRYVSYTEGTLKAEREGLHSVVGLVDPGPARQLFSDRKYTVTNLQSCTFLRGRSNMPFNIMSADGLSVQISKNPADGGNTLIVTTTLLSWGNGRERFVGQCRNNLIFGFNDSTRTIFTISLFNMNP